jgi:hypothetical protein
MPKVGGLSAGAGVFLFGPGVVVGKGVVVAAGVVVVLRFGLIKTQQWE